MISIIIVIVITIQTFVCVCVCDIFPIQTCKCSIQIGHNAEIVKGCKGHPEPALAGPVISATKIRGGQSHCGLIKLWLSSKELFLLLSLNVIEVRGG